MTTTELKSLTRKELETIAKRLNISGRHAMKKGELVEVLRSVQRQNRKTVDLKCTNGVTVADLKSLSIRSSNGRVVPKEKIVAKNGQASKRPVGRSNRLASSRDSQDGSSEEEVKDQIRVNVLDSHWLHANWNLSVQILDRARVALGVEWHQAVPVIRVFVFDGEEGSSGVTTCVKDIEVTGNVDHWYIPVESALCTYALQIGYRTFGGKFFALARSSKVTTPQENLPITTERDKNGKESAQRNGSRNTGCPGSNGQFSKDAQPLFKKNRSYLNSISADEVKPNGNGSDQRDINQDFQIALQTELIIHGKTHPDSDLTCLGDAVSVDENGEFSLRLAIPEGRQIVPFVAATPDGKEKHTTVLGIMKNTKKLEPQSLEEPLL